ncbi:putative nucleotide-binding protein 1 protein [Eutypa lata UCREL1]|uniref:Putative nucleotide-binding protein 1 protein n=1 Tax=Eutypa lata (strain UCR-EL1) TaxID=1287681 RepID=M7SIA0_EUTLA|nr:putative nucleotide-binding protein 1 protein [Eutypa lata UCREL1]
MRPTTPRLFQAFRTLQHENPLGLPRTGTIPRMQRGLPERRKIRDVAKVVAVSSAKGGVGKSTVAANLSLAFARLGYRSGILDADIFGPSIPTLFNLSGEPRLSPSEDAPVVWRGLMVMKALQQLLHEVDWGGLDVLVLDLPPGTGDTQLSVTQQVVLDVTTPHTLAVKDAVKGINMFKKVNVPLLGLVQNMSLFNCPHCHNDTAVFGSNERVQGICQEHSIELLGDIPLHQSVGDDGQRGKPTVVSEPESDRAKAFVQIAQQVGSKIGL